MIILPTLVFLALVAARNWDGWLLAPYLSAGGIAALNRGLAVAMVVAIAVLTDGLVRYFYWHRYWRRRRGQETPALIRDLMTIAILLLGLSLGLWWVEGLSFTGFITASGATAIILGIALQTVIQDLFSGLSINLDGSYALGDWLTVFSDQMPEPAYGQVTAMTWRSTFMVLEDGRRLMVPNHLVTANAVLNHSRPQNPSACTVRDPVGCAHFRRACHRHAAGRGDEGGAGAQAGAHARTLRGDRAADIGYGLLSGAFLCRSGACRPGLGLCHMYRALLDVVQKQCPADAGHPGRDDARSRT